MPTSQVGSCLFAYQELTAHRIGNVLPLETNRNKLDGLKHLWAHESTECLLQLFQNT
jgi:hypothetical protein